MVKLSSKTTRKVLVCVVTQLALCFYICKTRLHAVEPLSKYILKARFSSYFSKKGHQALFGMQNGQIRIQNLIHSYDISELGPYWCLGMHDNVYGNITGLLQSYDETMLISTGNDGNFFLFTYMEKEQMDKKIEENKAKLPSARVSMITWMRTCKETILWGEYKRFYLLS